MVPTQMLFLTLYASNQQVRHRNAYCFSHAIHQWFDIQYSTVDPHKTAEIGCQTLSYQDTVFKLCMLPWPFHCDVCTYTAWSNSNLLFGTFSDITCWMEQVFFFPFFVIALLRHILFAFLCCFPLQLFLFHWNEITMSFCLLPQSLLCKLLDIQSE